MFNFELEKKILMLNFEFILMFNFELEKKILMLNFDLILNFICLDF